MLDLTHPRPCQAARVVFDAYSDLNGYGSFENMDAKDFRYLGERSGYYAFIYRKHDADNSRRPDAPEAAYIEVDIGLFGQLVDQRRMTVPLEELATAKGSELSCSG